MTTSGHASAGTELPLFGPGAFELLSREWVRVGWALQYYHTFTWCGRPVLQLPEDLLRLQETICQLKPDVIVEAGVFRGGSLLFHATLCEVMGKGRVIGIDREIEEGTRLALASHRLADRIRIIEGDSTAGSTIAAVRELIPFGSTVMVILDSHHSADHVNRELECYAPLVTEGFCMIAADGIMRDLANVPGGDPVWLEDNPATAAQTFLLTHPEFEMRMPEWQEKGHQVRNPVTYWTDGWLWRVAGEC